MSSREPVGDREEVKCPGNFIELDRFLKLAGLAATGGQAKQIIKAGLVQVNGETETRRGRKLRAGDVVVYQGESYSIEGDGEGESEE
jgi:ribosome-associated protein